jgi:hypothetical protein
MGIVVLDCMCNRNLRPCRVIPGEMYPKVLREPCAIMSKCEQCNVMHMFACTGSLRSIRTGVNVAGWESIMAGAAGNPSCGCILLFQVSTVEHV